MSANVDYVRMDDGGRVAYQVVGDGDRDVYFLRTPFDQLDLQWEEPHLVRFLDGLTSLGRVIMHDPRTGGLSDGLPVRARARADTWTDEILAVAEVVGFGSGVMIGARSGAAALFAAQHPEMVTHLVLIDEWVKALRSDDFPGTPEHVFDEWVRNVDAAWGRAPLPGDEIEPHPDLDWMNRYRRAAQTPTEVVRLYEAVAQWDVRSALPLVCVPTLVLCHRDTVAVRPEWSRYIADHIPGAQLVELPGTSHLAWWFPNPERVIDEITGFIEATEGGAEDSDRVFATVLFTDIVASTEHASRMGDRGWSETLDLFEAVVARQIERFGGRLLKFTGDGHMATFDRPGRAAEAAVMLRESAQALDLEIRAGIHAGEVETRGGDIGGIAVNIAARVMSLAREGQVLVSRTFTDLVAGSGLEFEEFGVHELKGVPGKWQLYALSPH